MPEALRDRLRFATLAATLLMIVGTVLPWIRAWRPGTGWFDVSGFEQGGDGGLVLELGLLAGVLVWSTRAWQSRIGPLVAGPGLAGVACLIVLRLWHENGLTFFRLLTNAGGHGSFQPGFWLTVLGAIGTTACGAIAIWRSRGRVSYAPGASAAGIAGALGGAIGAVGGFVAGSQIATLLTDGSPVGASGVLIVLAFAFAFGGAWFGAVAGSGIVRALRRR